VPEFVGLRFAELNFFFGKCSAVYAEALPLETNLNRIRAEKSGTTGSLSIFSIKKWNMEMPFKKG
jgi:hypothetical protein